MYELKQSHRGRQMLQARGKTVLDYLQSAATFTAGMAKRTGPGPFAAAPIVQGNWDGSGTPDVLSASTGAQISGSFHANFDEYQGSIVWCLTPEYDEPVGAAFMFHIGDSAEFYVRYENAGTRFKVRIGSTNMNVIQALVAGTTYCCVLRWDMKNTLDGTNYVCLSVNDVHTFGITSVTEWTVPSTINIGSDAVQQPANAIIEGLVITRLPLFDGTYGVDKGEGDVINQIWAAGAGADLATICGPWDTVFSLPTDSTPGALTSGAGEAWSMPHASSVLTDSFCETTYGASAWGDEGTPSVGPADLANAEKIFPWGYKWTCDAANEGITQTLAGLDASEDYVIRVMAHCVSANNIRVRIWDETNGEQARGTVDFDFGASSSRTAPGVALFAFELPTIARSGAAADCVSISVKIMGIANTQEVFLHQVELYENLIDGPSMETGAGNPFIADGWTNQDLDAGDTETEAGTVHSGAASVEWNPGAILGEGQYSTLTTTPGKFFGFGGYSYGDASDGFRLGPVDAARALLQYSATDYQLLTSVAASWQATQAVYRALHANPRMLVEADAIAGDGWTDDFWAIEMDDVSLTVTPASEANSEENVTTELRVCGYASLTQPLQGQCKASSGYVRGWIRPRHNAADLLKFGVTSPYWAQLWGDVNNRIVVYVFAANQLTLFANVNGAAVNTNWDCTGAIVANTKYLLEIEYTANWIQLRIDGVVRATDTRAIAFAVVPTTAYWGSYLADFQADATFDEP